MDFKDHFSAQATAYARFRPTYPPELFAYLAEQAPKRKLAWDCASGNGQAALALSRHFERVIATDASAAQVAHAPTAANVEYRVEPAEWSTLAPDSCDLVLVAQALHWFDRPRFFAECRRVLKHRGIAAALSYNLLHVDDQVDAILHRFYHDIVGPFWPPERRLVETGYAGLEWPFEPLTTPEFEMVATWDSGTLLGYLRTWSASQRYLEHSGNDPVAEIEPELLAVWNESKPKRRVTWPLAVKVARVTKK